jgi:chorismate dehydratase
MAQQRIRYIDQLLLDPNSRTSNGLAKVLFRRHWMKTVRVMEEDNHVQHIKGNKAGVVIGDQALQWRPKFRYVWDLAYEWKQWADLPFAFAVWAFDRHQVSDAFLDRMLNAFEWGLNNLQNTADRWAVHFDITPEAAYSYFVDSIDYDFDTAKQIALKLFLKELAPLEGVQMPQTLQLTSALLQERSL